MRDKVRGQMHSGGQKRQGQVRVDGCGGAANVGLFRMKCMDEVQVEEVLGAMRRLERRVLGKSVAMVRGNTPLRLAPNYAHSPPIKCQSRAGTICQTDQVFIRFWSRFMMPMNL